MRRWSALAFGTSFFAASAVFAATVATPQFGVFGVDISGMQPNIAPGDDFYAYVNGAWNSRTEIPSDQSGWGQFQVLRELSDSRTRDILEKAAADPSGAARKVGDLYASFMDEARIDARGAAPLKADLDPIAAITSPADLAVAFAKAGRNGVNVPILVGVGTDAKDPDHFVVTFAQGGLGLPDRDYYLIKDNPKYAVARVAYIAHVARTLGLAGIPDASAKAQAIFDLETRIAAAQWSRVESRQADKRYNPVATAELGAGFKGFDWASYLSSVGLDHETRVIVSQPSAIQGIAGLTTSTPLDTWKAYLSYHTISARVDVLPKAFVDEDFAFQQVLSGTPELKARWKRGVAFVNSGMGEAVGQLYVARYFPPQAKAKADALVANLLSAMRDRLERVSWMAPETKVKALRKLANFRVELGYPKHWRDYDALGIQRDDAYGNEVRFTQFDWDHDKAKLGTLADRGEWSATPQTVNAFARPSWDMITFPAAILQPPFFDPNADPAVNYGGIGAVIGHEISHHFDDQGRKYDEHGHLADWWTPDDITRFKAYTDRVVAQYSAYAPLPGVHVNGALTLGENMADLAGINVAHEAWLISLKGRTPPVIGGFTGEQRFFLGFGQVWRTKSRDSALQRQLATDPHTPGAWRPYVVRNVDAWYAAFGVKPGSRYYLAPADRIKVW